MNYDPHKLPKFPSCEEPHEFVYQLLCQDITRHKLIYIGKINNSHYSTIAECYNYGGALTLYYFYIPQLVLHSELEYGASLNKHYLLPHDSTILPKMFPLDYPLNQNISFILNNILKLQEPQRTKISNTIADLIATNLAIHITKPSEEILL